MNASKQTDRHAHCSTPLPYQALSNERALDYAHISETPQVVTVEWQKR